MSLFQEVAALLVLSALFGAIALKLRQPLIIAYIVVGILAGPSFMGLSSEMEPLALLAEIGITVLLFVVGLKLDTQLISSLGRVALIAGTCQIALTLGLGYGLCILLGMSSSMALYMAMALAFSSTIIVVKLLSDKKEIDSLHGRIAMGILIIQDIAVVASMLVLNLLSPKQATAEQPMSLFWLGVLALITVAGIYLISSKAMPWLLKAMSRSPELLMLFAVAWGTALAGIAESFGLSKELGAFVAGVSLASTPLREAISSRLTSLRDFLLLFFFLYLGMQLDFSHINGQIFPALVLSAFVLIGKPLIIMPIVGALGYRKRTGFVAGLTLAQISEFSIIFVGVGVGLEVIDPTALGLITLVALITITLSTYMAMYTQPLFARLAPMLSLFERKVAYRETASDTPNRVRHPEIIIYGMGRYGRLLAEQFQQAGKRVLGVDFAPDELKLAKARGLSVCYGDAEDADFLAHLPLHDAKLMVSTIPQREVNAILFRALRSNGFKGQITLSAFHEGDAEAFRHAGAGSVLIPYADAAESAARRLLDECMPVSKPAAPPHVDALPAQD